MEQATPQDLASNNSCSLTMEQIMSDLHDAPKTDMVFNSRPPGVTESGTASDSDQLVRNCVRFVGAHQNLLSDSGLSSLPKIAQEVEQYSEELKNAISSTTDR